MGGPLACGGRYEPWMMGVANKTLRCGTRIRLCYRRCVTVRVMDRGPYVAGREFDLMIRPAAAIGFDGVGTVRWRRDR